MSRFYSKACFHSHKVQKPPTERREPVPHCESSSELLQQQSSRRHQNWNRSAPIFNPVHRNQGGKHAVLSYAHLWPNRAKGLSFSSGSSAPTTSSTICCTLWKNGSLDRLSLPGSLTASTEKRKQRRNDGRRFFWINICLYVMQRKRLRKLCMWELIQMINFLKI